jgi:DNA-binding response OmpR family regulator
LNTEGLRTPFVPVRPLLLVTDHGETERWLRHLTLPDGLEVVVGHPDHPREIEAVSPLLAVLDLSGRWPEAVELCRSWRSACDERSVALVGLVPSDRVGELEPHWGLDDFLVYPSTTAELLARLRFLLSRLALSAPANGLRLGDLSMDFDRYEVTLRSETLYLTFKEYELLKFLATHLDRVFTREALLAQVWGYDYYGGTRTVDVHVRRLREKLGPRYGELIQTVRQVGYRFVRELR